MSYQHEREVFIAQMTQEGIPLDVCLRVLRNANTIQRLAARECSVEMSEAESKREELRAAACEARIAKMLAPYGVTVDTSGDPRGFCVKLMLPSGKYNTWGGAESGYGVPTREY